jgi:putative toxin-antitoxin system antitoxin component (TIGR02293 family)
MAVNSSLSYARRIGVNVKNTVDLIEKINSGLPYRAFEKLQSEIGIPSKELAKIVQIAPRTLTRRKTAKRFQPDESDRILRASRVYDRALDLFDGDREEARVWLISPRQTFNGSSPLEFAITEVGAREVEDLIARLERGVFT